VSKPFEHKCLKWRSRKGKENVWEALTFPKINLSTSVKLMRKQVDDYFVKTYGVFYLWYYGVKNPKACRLATEVLGVERTD